VGSRGPGHVQRQEQLERDGAEEGAEASSRFRRLEARLMQLGLCLSVELSSLSSALCASNSFNEHRSMHNRNWRCS